MFDLNSAVADWKARASVGGACSRADLDELETHVRDSADRLVATGLSEEEAFLLALRRIGQPDQLRVEYAKENPGLVWRERAAWMFAGLVVWNALSAVSAVVAGGGLIGAAAAGAHGPALAVASIFASLLGLSVAASGAFFLYRRASRGGIRHGHGVWVAAGISLILVGHFASQAGQVALAKFIAVSEFGQMAVAQSIYSFAISLVMPLVFTLLAIRLHRTSPATDC